MKQTIDVIIPTYNGMPFLKQAVDSVLDQTHKDFILYIVDDASDDRNATKEYVKSLKDSRVNYLAKKHEGRSAARNYGIRVSKSTFIALLDADDTWHKAKLEKQIALISKDASIGMVYGLCDIIDEHNNKVGEITYQKRGWLFRYLLSGNRVSGGASMVLVRREVFEKVGIFSEDMSMAEDWELWLRIANKYRIDFVPEFLASYRVTNLGENPKYLDKARGLNHALDAMIEEFKLDFFDRARLGAACMSQACSLYLDGGDRRAAKRAFFKMLKYNPLAPFTSGRSYWFVYARVLFGNNLLRLARRRLSASYRARENQTK
jgi:glycosyltransferase involved in cell wall biosynthesis